MKRILELSQRMGEFEVAMDERPPLAEKLRQILVEGNVQELKEFVDEQSDEHDDVMQVQCMDVLYSL
jgi:hypothetical protein